MKTFEVRIEYKITVKAHDEFNAEHEARKDVDSFLGPHDVRVIEVTEDPEQP
jgi:hypothetical protein